MFSIYQMREKIHVNGQWRGDEKFMLFWLKEYTDRSRSCRCGSSNGDSQRADDARAVKQMMFAMKTLDRN